MLNPFVVDWTSFGFLSLALNMTSFPLFYDKWRNTCFSIVNFTTLVHLNKHCDTEHNYNKMENIVSFLRITQHATVYRYVILRDHTAQKRSAFVHFR